MNSGPLSATSSCCDNQARVQDAESGSATRAELLGYDDPAVLQRFAVATGAGGQRANLLIEGITCAACVYLLESRIGALPGVARFDVNGQTHRGELDWRADEIAFSAILDEVEQLGYRARPFDPGRRQQAIAAERRAVLMRLALSALLGMQVMMATLALYFGDWYGMGADFHGALRWTSLVLTTPLVVYAAAPFFGGAWRCLRNRQLGMDVSVSLAIALAYGGSAWSTVAGHGAVYFESVAMFVLLLTFSRYVELGGRIRATAELDRLGAISPDQVTRVRSDCCGERTERVVPTLLAVGDELLIAAGERLPVDGELLTDGAALDESVLSGENLPVTRYAGDAVLAGSLNAGIPIRLRVTRLTDESFVAEVSRLAERAALDKPRVTLLANRVASWFIAAVLVAAFAAYLVWNQLDPERAFAVALAMLVVACPCALALATPAAMIAGTNAMLRRGVVAVNAQAVDALARARGFLFDKTGTLTSGRLHLDDIETASDLSSAEALTIAVALAVQSRHPLSRALVAAHGETATAAASEVEELPGFGLRGVVAGRRWWLGSREFVVRESGAEPEGGSDDASRCWLAGEEGIAAGFRFGDQLRAGAAELCAYLQDRGLGRAILSGDNAAAAGRVADALGIDDVGAGLTPEAKLVAQQGRAGNDVWVCVGDGVNDAPMLAAGGVAVAIRDASAAAARQADLIMLTDDLGALQAAHRTARQTSRVIKQNITWALAYNLVALPVAACGLIAPWMAALGMSVSSLLVITNAARIDARALRRR